MNAYSLRFVLALLSSSALLAGDAQAQYFGVPRFLPVPPPFGPAPFGPPVYYGRPALPPPVYVPPPVTVYRPRVDIELRSWGVPSVYGNVGGGLSIQTPGFSYHSGTFVPDDLSGAASWVDAAERLHRALSDHPDGEVWLEYLRPLDVVAAHVARSRELIQLAERYAGVVANPDLAWLHNLDGFREVYQQLNQLTGASLEADMGASLSSQSSGDSVLERNDPNQSETNSSAGKEPSGETLPAPLPTPDPQANEPTPAKQPVPAAPAEPTAKTAPMFNQAPAQADGLPIRPI